MDKIYMQIRQHRTFKDKNVFGTVISLNNTPDVYKFYFVLYNDIQVAERVRVGRYVSVNESSELIIGQIVNIFKVNEYFLNANSIRETRTNSSLISSIFPVDQWEYQVAEVNVLGSIPIMNIFDSKENGNGTRKKYQFEKSSIPVSPGNQVEAMDVHLLENFLGFNMVDGLNLGNVNVEDIPLKIDLTKLIQKHFAILAMSGAGKSYLMSVILEEFIKRRKDNGRVATIIIDTHGEYSSMLRNISSTKKSKLKNAKIEVINGSFIQVATPFMTLGSFFNYMPNMSPVQGRELFRIFNELKKRMKTFDLKDLEKAMLEDEKLGTKSKEALQGWLYLLGRYGLFSSTEYPRLHETLKPGVILVIDMSGITSMKHKQIIVDYIASRSFYLRKNGMIPPFCLIIEEAHQFVPQASAASAMASKTIETIAREGRKFFASLCLISQRPVHLNTTVLSQCNTHFILRISNPNDLEHVKASSEKITNGVMKVISSLPVGQALIVGGAVNVPVFFKVREREFLPKANETLLIDVIKSFDRVD
ncbi:MAG: ATP-binding protein [Promethearchaeota archaeon]